MATIISKKLDLGYNCANGKKYTLSVPDYKDDITDAEVKTSAEGIQTQGIFEPQGYPLIELVSAVKIDTSKTEVAL